MFNLIPCPNRIIRKGTGRFTLPRRIYCDFGGFEPWCVRAFLERTGIVGAGDDASRQELTLSRDTALPEEGYVLHITEDGIAIRASEEIGIVWALTTVANMLKDGELPHCLVEDAPRCQHRGLNLDCCRHFFPAEAVKKIIEEISLAKMNVLHWHLSNDQGFRIESRLFPNLNEAGGAFYTQVEIADIVEYARNRGIEVLPEISLPGHVSAILAAYPEHSCSGRPVRLASCGGIYPIILCPGKEETFDFLTQFLGEAMDLFPGGRFHIGGDEAPKSEWGKCPHCARRMAELDLTDYEDLQGYFTQRVNDVVKEAGKRAICWNDVLLAADHPSDTQIQYWTLQHRQSMREFVEQGGQWIYSDMFELYFDYPYSMTSLKKVYMSIPHLGKEPFADSAGLLGMEACMWTEHVADVTRLEELLFPRIYALAEICWGGRGDYADFKVRLAQTIRGDLHKGINYTGEDWWEPKGRARREEAIGFATGVMTAMSEEAREETMRAVKPSKEFAQSFIKEFFKPTDVPFLMKMGMVK